MNQAGPLRTDFNKPVIFFDGVCGLCNFAVDFILTRDTTGKFLFAPLQGETASRLLPAHLASQLNTVVVVEPSGHHFVKSEAILFVGAKLGGAFSYARVLRVVPTAFRDFIYDVVASHRYQWFGKRETCRLPTKEERSRFLP